MVKSDVQMVRRLARSSAKLGLEAKNSLYEIFHENTKLGPLTTRAYSAWILKFNRSHGAQQILEEGHKVYTLMERRELPQVQARNELERTIADRRSIRRFSGAPLGLEELARLLFFTYGRTDRRGRFRAVASGGALYPLELYVVALEVDGLQPGIYHYGVETGALDVVEPGEFRAALKQVVNCEGLDIDNAALAIVLTASFRRSTAKYLDRGYRMVLMEAGEAAQNLGLLATSMGLGACLVGGFNDDRLSDFLDIDGVDEAPLLPVLVGRPAPVVAGKDPTQPMPFTSGRVQADMSNGSELGEERLT
jgi:SagB-type dehydrogenase family enzyme